jgi:hypothetical protein
LLEVRQFVLDHLYCYHLLSLHVFAFDDLTKGTSTQNIQDNVPINPMLVSLELLLLPPLLHTYAHPQTQEYRWHIGCSQSRHYRIHRSRLVYLVSLAPAEDFVMSCIGIPDCIFDRCHSSASS